MLIPVISVFLFCAYLFWLYLNTNFYTSNYDLLLYIWIAVVTSQILFVLRHKKVPFLLDVPYKYAQSALINAALGFIVVMAFIGIEILYTENFGIYEDKIYATVVKKQQSPIRRRSDEYIYKIFTSLYLSSKGVKIDRELYENVKENDKLVINPKSSIFGFIIKQSDISIVK